MTKSEGSSDDDLVFVPSVVSDFSESPGDPGCMASDSLPIGHSGSIEMKKVGGSASATSSRRAAVDTDASLSLTKTSDIVQTDDIDLARSSSDKNKKVQSSDQLYYVNEVSALSNKSVQLHI